LSNVGVAPVFYGQDWNYGHLARQTNELTNYLGFLTNSSFMDQLNEYGVGRGGLVTHGMIDNGIAAGQNGETVDDAAIQNVLDADIANGSLPVPDGNRLYMVFMPPNVRVTSSIGTSPNDFRGYHNLFTDGGGAPVYYAVITHPLGNGDINNLNDFDSFTKLVSHELAEAVTDPVVGDPTNGGWFEDATGSPPGPFVGFPTNGESMMEICDFADQDPGLGVLGGYVVQPVWSEQQGASVLPPDATPLNDLDPLPRPWAAPVNLSAVANVFTHSYEHFADLVSQDYSHYLGRTPVPAEVDAWVRLMQQGTTDEQVLANFIGSTEYYEHTGGTDQAWVQAMYQDLLGRTPMQQEVDAWVQALAGGAARGNVALGFATSPEAEGIVVQADYEQYLGRGAKDAEVAAWVGAFTHGMTNEQVVAGFVGSYEYFNNPAKGRADDAGWVLSAYQDVLLRTPGGAETLNWYQVLD
jgi:hypothetical protein